MFKVGSSEYTFSPLENRVGDQILKNPVGPISRKYFIKFQRDRSNLQEPLPRAG